MKVQCPNCDYRHNVIDRLDEVIDGVEVLLESAKSQNRWADLQTQTLKRFAQNLAKLKESAD